MTKPFIASRPTQFIAECKKPKTKRPNTNSMKNLPIKEADNCHENENANCAY
jgi:hypothetical protein